MEIVIGATLAPFNVLVHYDKTSEWFYHIVQIGQIINATETQPLGPCLYLATSQTTSDITQTLF